jgi:hypothetical protein
MRLPSASLIAVLGALGGFESVLAWGAAGHEIVATIAQMHLHPPVLPILCSILYPEDTHSQQSCSLASVATWADRIRFRARWSAPLHYVGSYDDHPPDACAFPGPQGWEGRPGGNVLYAIRNVTSILNEFVQYARPIDDLQHVESQNLALAQEALKFLIHFVGDLHQPLHLTARNRGGNGDKVSWNGRVTSVFDLTYCLLRIVLIYFEIYIRSGMDCLLPKRFALSLATTHVRYPCHHWRFIFAVRSTIHTSAESCTTELVLESIRVSREDGKTRLKNG